MSVSPLPPEVPSARPTPAGRSHRFTQGHWVPWALAAAWGCPHHTGAGRVPGHRQLLGHGEGRARGHPSPLLVRSVHILRKRGAGCQALGEQPRPAPAMSEDSAEEGGALHPEPRLSSEAASARGKKEGRPSSGSLTLMFQRRLFSTRSLMLLDTCFSAGKPAPGDDPLQPNGGRESSVDVHRPRPPDSLESARERLWGPGSWLVRDEMNGHRPHACSLLR